ncbi:hypothetical protein SDC9_128604 [bioreactor metagenome]|uniref:Uncharacterized protein n=1 Tax=bioreactor metagenome TaxID=1076179 RepID=A0A645CWL2_9ZZZZ
MVNALGVAADFGDLLVGPLEGEAAISGGHGFPKLRAGDSGLFQRGGQGLLRASAAGSEVQDGAAEQGRVPVQHHRLGGGGADVYA